MLRRNFEHLILHLQIRDKIKTTKQMNVYQVAVGPTAADIQWY